MQAKGFTWEWDDSNGNCKIISPKLEAVIAGSNGNKAFFNSIVAAFKGNVDKYNQYGKSVVFGDGSSFSPEIIEELNDWMHQNKCAYKWQAGDFYVIDNTINFHSRETFVGPRKVYAAIGRGYFDELEAKEFRVLKSGDRIPSVALECLDTNLLQKAMDSGVQHLVIDGAAVEGKGLKNGNRDQLFISLVLKLSHCDDL